MTRWSSSRCDKYPKAVQEHIQARNYLYWEWLRHSQRTKPKYTYTTNKLEDVSSCTEEVSRRKRISLGFQTRFFILEETQIPKVTREFEK